MGLLIQTAPQCVVTPDLQHEVPAWQSIGRSSVVGRHTAVRRYPWPATQGACMAKCRAFIRRRATHCSASLPWLLLNLIPNPSPLTPHPSSLLNDQPHAVHHLALTHFQLIDAWGQRLAIDTRGRSA